MSIINSFLQKNKVHESHHGVYMVVIAYVLSAALLFFGSDAFYGITSKAEKISSISDEATNNVTEEAIIDPYGLAARNREEEPVPEPASDDTNWLFGQGMNDSEYDTMLLYLDEMEIYQAVELGADEATESAVESFSADNGKGKTSLSLTREEVGMLERIVEAEATGEDMIGRILVANVVMNRIADEEFPDTVEEVIFQNSDGEYQFSPISDKRYWSVKVSKKTEEAVRRALAGEDYSEGALYFMARKKTKKSSAKWFDNNLEWLFKHGGHEFYKNR